ncbi:hypothetical protein CVT26_007208 [Gymnopilus dilepis]|uniref:Uncharacterized protein n=1 Tax=Gymnopilus dilepis TaxID=231916 RepID=A0A409XA46_9AGAR|nr:hypothetical protein CVT26_007208 [Gymnopilus dilepis]
MNTAKTKAMIIGPWPQQPPKLELNGRSIEFVDSFKYVGVHFQSTHRFIFAEHYNQKATQALRNVFASVVWIESLTGDLWPLAMLRVFMARVDPHLVHGCEVAVDVHGPSFKLLDDVHVFALRRILQVGSRSVKAALYTETGTQPLLYRRMVLRLRCLRYLITLPPQRLAAAAYRDSLTLLQNGQSCWLGDIKYELEHLPVPVEMQLRHVTSVEGVDELIDRVGDSCATWVHSEIENNERTPLLRGRLTPGQTPDLRTIFRFRPYLVDVVVPSHRRALTRLLFSEHCLAVEQLRRKDRRRNPVPRDLRLCRFCLQEVEDEPHALLYCLHCPMDIIERRSELLAEAKILAPTKDWSITARLNRYQNVRQMLAIRPLLPKLAEFVFHVLKTYDEYEMYIPPGFYVPD